MAEEELELVEPDYIQEFACLAGDCPDTCCANWEIAFDEEACARYATAGADADVAAGCRAAVKRNTEPVADGTVPGFRNLKMRRRRPAPGVVGAADVGI